MSDVMLLDQRDRVFERVRHAGRDQRCRHQIARGLRDALPARDQLVCQPDDVSLADHADGRVALTHHHTRDAVGV